MENHQDLVLKTKPKLEVATKEDIVQFMKTNYKSVTKILCFYNSLLNKLITDEHFMVIPFYDKMTLRCHCGIFIIF